MYVFNAHSRERLYEEDLVVKVSSPPSSVLNTRPGNYLPCLCQLIFRLSIDDMDIKSIAQNRACIPVHQNVLPPYCH